MARNYEDEDVLKHVREAFSETIKLKVQQLRRFIKKGTNPTLTGDFIEELVRGFIQKWIGHRWYLKGTFYSEEFEASGATPLQIDGIVYDPTAGPTVLHEGNFAVVHPAFCTSVVEVKTSHSSICDFEKRLRQIYCQYMHHVTTPQVMGIVIADPDPEKHSRIEIKKDEYIWAYEYNTVPWCPIFILFQEQDNEYTPFEPAIDAMIRAIYGNQTSRRNYL